MPSAARPFTDHLVTDLAMRGVTIAPITLHAAVSSLEAGEQPLPERFRVPATTARLVEHTKRNGGRVIAVGTTVTPESSHLLLLDAVAGAELVTAAYHAALEERYLWHEFGDSCLFLPDRDQ
jgi:S-adenosylmethionine:tRNA ribosyltransferase-isomerase